MCGIAGKLILSPDGRVTSSEIEAMLRPIAHRGPDGQGIHLQGPVGLGHRRLSIIDLEGGAQPMANEDGTLWIVFNGEIYNYRSLRRDLIASGHLFRSQSDTEVILHLYEEHGDDCLWYLDGMFAFALWDDRRQRLLIARDRVGIKPLYYSANARVFHFASELKSIVADPEVPRDLDPVALHEFLSFYYVPGEETLFRSVRKLPPGHFLVCEDGRVSINRYWDLEFTRTRYAHLFADVVTELTELLARCVSNHMIADVPVGVLLSGGVDSSAVLSFAVRASSRPISTFTIGFDDSAVVDERPYARLAAERFGTDHHELSLNASEFWDSLATYAWHMEEPVCEPPAIALHHITRLARQTVKVLLSGEGGDEAFAGYPNYAHLLRLERLSRLLGPFSRSAGACATLAGRCLNVERARRYGAALGRPLHRHYFSRASSPSFFFNQANGGFFAGDWHAAPGNVAPDARMEAILAPAQRWGLLEQMLYADTKTWLPDDLLVKADKMTMANSVELRVPLLDHHVLEFAASLPPHYKVAGRETKRVLKAAFARTVPNEILNRKKAGFPVPYDSWLRGPLAGNTRDVLLSTRATQRGYFTRRGLEQLLDAHERHGGYAKEVFSLLALEFWHQAFTDPVAPRRAHEAAVMV